MKFIYNKWGIGVILIVLIGVGIIEYIDNHKQDKRALWNDYKAESVMIEGHEHNLIIAENPEQWSKGLMYVNKPFDYDGMIFKFKEASGHTFWNKNTYEDLKLYWMLEGEVVGKSDLPSIEKSGEIVTVSSSGPADTVVEIIKK